MFLRKDLKTITKFNLNLNILRKIHSYCHGTFPQPPELMSVSMLVTLLQSSALGQGEWFLCYELQGHPYKHGLWTTTGCFWECSVQGLRHKRYSLEYRAQEPCSEILLSSEAIIGNTNIQRRGLTF